MKRIHLLRTTVAADAVAGLFAAARSEGLRIGWLDLTSDPTSERAAGGPAGELARAAELGALRAVAVSAGRAVTVKRVVGPPVLRDLLREHFLGCAAVLVRVPAEGVAPSVAGAGELPLLQPIEPVEAIEAAEAEEGGWRIVPAAGPDSRALRLTSAELVARLRRPRPWGESADRPD